MLSLTRIIIKGKAQVICLFLFCVVLCFSVHMLTRATDGNFWETWLKTPSLPVGRLRLVCLWKIALAEYVVGWQSEPHCTVSGTLSSQWGASAAGVSLRVFRTPEVSSAASRVRKSLVSRCWIRRTCSSAGAVPLTESRGASRNMDRKWEKTMCC